MKSFASKHSELLETLFLALLVGAFAFRSIALALFFAVVVGALVMASVRLLAQGTNREKNAMLALAALLTIALPISVMRNETSMLHYCIAMSAMAAAFVLTRDLRAYRQASRFTLFGAQCAVLIYLLQHGLGDFPLENIIPDSSANGVTSYLVVLQINYCLINYLQTKRFSSLTSLATVGIAVVGYSRGSILAAVAILTINLVFATFSGSRTRGIVAVAGSLVVLGFSVAQYSDLISDFVVANTKIGSGLYDLHRTAIISDYFRAMNGLTLITGVDYQGTVIANEYNGNPHNSFIRAHHIFGLPYLLSICAFPVYLCNKLHRWNVKAYAALLGLVLLFRAATEPVLFPTMLDVLFFAACFALARTPQRAGDIAIGMR